ncbi:NAD-dependent succinate-semialdehyde dehydrogenase [Arthrobacter sp. PM3]|uniref:NAD-dependent succinate-semialdehyde dehydrogenase n=1 Tax=Arthrobacter sp. PM3 TaxID=2017685 RepID=UPI000E1059A0|nr:NAD-dependent succinate-semialdehyde dehydrogenase [Arthrobacter sp. PM3]AXJ10902.1 succinate-semialdehyde dehydrogenase [Arthrobacter sp. PM3]
MTHYAVINPATGQTEAEYPAATDEHVQDCLAAAEKAVAVLAGFTAAERAALLRRVADLHAERRDELAAIITREVGKPISQSLGEVDIVISIYRYYAENGPGFLAEDVLNPTAGGSAVVRKEGLGALLGIMPWNFPYYQVARFAAPNLMIGNTILLKPAPQCPESALAMEAIFRDAGLPDGAYATLFATNDQVADAIADPRVAGVSLTGSERAGSAVAEIAGRHLKKVVLELGGSDPFVVLDADGAGMDALVKRAVAARLGNAGQACNAAKRFVVLDAVYDEFVENFKAALAATAPGDPTDPATFLGPLSSQAAADTLQGQLDAAVAGGATVLLAGGKTATDSAYFRPAVLADVTPDMGVYYEELFGPVAMVFRARSEAHAIAIANDTPFGLGASVHSGDADRAARVADQITAGMVSINEAGGSAAELPFGGVKRSGVGRELGRYGMEEFVNRKLVRTR